MFQELESQLKKLMSSLDDANDLDPKTLNEVNLAISPLQSVVENNRPVNEIEQTMETLVLDFEHNHPVIAEAIRDTIQILGRIGI